MNRLFEPELDLNKSWSKEMEVIWLKPGNLNVQTLKVIELTRTQVITEGGLRFRRQDGTKVAGDRSDGFIKPFTPEVRTELKRRIFIRRIKFTDLYTMPVEKLAKILRIISEK